jgi:sugar O-acyltransferase (sialic acid O-acetyltransferase NeuD family)
MTLRKTIGIFGTSGMAREVGDIAIAVGLEPVYIAHSESTAKELGSEYQVILEKDLSDFSEQVFVIGIADGKIRKAIADRYGETLSFANLIHPDATFGQGQLELIEKQRGVIVASGVRFTNSIKCGDFCIFNQNTTIAHDCAIGSFVHIAPGANISGNVDIEENCWVGAGAVINQGKPDRKLKLGKNATIGSGAVVLGDCSPDATYVGVPSRRVP